jgi:UDP-N-acetylglucosamine 1-carboxyvinyltransferase
MSAILIHGGVPLHGTVQASGSKNASLPILCATLLNERPVSLHNVPALQDVSVVGEVLKSLGASFERPTPNHTIQVDASAVRPIEPPYELVNKMRASFLVLGPLLARFGEARVPRPGGCEIGARPVDEHIAAMRALGAEITYEAGLVIARADRLKGTEIYLNIISVGATENTIMAATLAEGATVIHNAAIEPEVVDLCHFLSRCGIEIEGTGSNTLTIHGQRRISAAVDYSVIPDRIEAGTYLLALAGTGGTGTVQGARIEHLEALVMKMRECGIALEHDAHSISVRDAAQLAPIHVRSAPYPGFPTDLQPQMTALLTRTSGVSTVEETVFERRQTHIPELVRMGARIQISGDSAIIEGRTGIGPDGKLTPIMTGAPVESHDLRCAAALVIAGLMAGGETRVLGLHHLLRGYELLPDKLAGLGGRVEYVKLDPEPED